MEPIYFNTFDEYEKNLELVKAEIQEDQPSWLHYWFYRYLQISPYYWAMHLRYSKSKSDQERFNKIKEFNKKWSDRLMSIENVNEDFVRWWYSRGRFFFKHPSDFLGEDNIAQKPHFLFEINPLKRFNEPDVKYIKLSASRIYKRLYKKAIKPKTIALTINLQKNKKDTVLAFSNFIDKHYGSKYKELNSSHIVFYKSKFKEDTLRNCFKVYEMSIRQKKLNLFDLGIKAGVLRGAIADYNSKKSFFEKNIKIFRSYNSLRSATSRQIKYAYYFARNAGYHLFPFNKKVLHDRTELPPGEIEYIFDMLLQQSKLKKNQKNALIEYAKKEKKKNKSKVFLGIVNSLN